MYDKAIKLFFQYRYTGKNRTMTTVRNSVQLVGHLGKDVEMTEFDSGSKKAAFSLATNDYYKNSEGEKVQETQWHNIIAWGRTAENMFKYLAKGSEILLKGKLITRSYQDNSGNKKFITEILADEFVMFGKKTDPF